MRPNFPIWITLLYIDVSRSIKVKSEIPVGLYSLNLKFLLVRSGYISSYKSASFWDKAETLVILNLRFQIISEAFWRRVTGLLIYDFLLVLNLYTHAVTFWNISPWNWNGIDLLFRCHQRSDLKPQQDSPYMTLYQYLMETWGCYFVIAVWTAWPWVGPFGVTYGQIWWSSWTFSTWV